MADRQGAGHGDTGGILFRDAGDGGRAAAAAFADLLDGLGLGAEAQRSAGGGQRFRLRTARRRDWTPGEDTLGLRGRMGLHDDDADDLRRETLVALLAGPQTRTFDDFDALASVLRIRADIVGTAARTTLAFHTEQADRPPGHWHYSEERGFTLKPGACLVEALHGALLPHDRETRYAFSCCRATEYLALLGIAREAMRVDPELYEALRRQWERRALTADRFREVFLHEHGSLAAPLPIRYYVPGDRVWFRNPDDHSSDATGYEGSWVYYLGGGLFTNFWKPDRHFTLESKCLEVYYWREATCRDARGELAIDETEVEDRVRRCRERPERVAEVLAKMLRLRDPPGVYADGGCIDASREYPRAIVASRAGLRLPDA